MYCEQCGGQFKRAEEEYCPFCGTKAPPVTGGKEEAPKTEKVQNMAKIKAVLKASNHPLSPAIDSTFIIKIDSGKYQIKLFMLDSDYEQEISIPYGHHNAILEFYAYEDTTLTYPDTDERNNVEFDVDSTKTVSFTIQPGTLFKPKRLIMEYV